jgi:hypothetical protein
MAMTLQELERLADPVGLGDAAAVVEVLCAITKRKSSSSEPSRNTCPMRRGKEGKHMERSIYLRSMSARRATGS